MELTSRETLERVLAKVRKRGLNRIAAVIELCVEEKVEPTVALWYIRGKVEALQAICQCIEEEEE